VRLAMQDNDKLGRAPGQASSKRISCICTHVQCNAPGQGRACHFSLPRSSTRPVGRHISPTARTILSPFARLPIQHGMRDTDHRSSGLEISMKTAWSVANFGNAPNPVHQ
jgi:hypothetical protein